MGTTPNMRLAASGAAGFYESVVLLSNFGVFGQEAASIRPAGSKPKPLWCIILSS